jgi:hypothetical protein
MLCHCKNRVINQVLLVGKILKGTKYFSSSCITQIMSLNSFLIRINKHTIIFGIRDADGSFNSIAETQQEGFSFGDHQALCCFSFADEIYPSYKVDVNLTLIEFSIPLFQKTSRLCFTSFIIEKYQVQSEMPFCD